MKLELPQISELLALRKKWPHFEEAQTLHEKIVSDHIDATIYHLSNALVRFASSSIESDLQWVRQHAAEASQVYKALKALIFQELPPESCDEQGKAALQQADEREAMLTALEVDALDRGESIEAAFDDESIVFKEIGYRIGSPEKISLDLHLESIQLANMWTRLKDSPHVKMQEAAKLFKQAAAEYATVAGQMMRRFGDGGEWEFTSEDRKQLEYADFDLIGKAYCVIQETI